MTTETIAAVATPPGRGGIGIVRVSGPRAGAIARAILHAEPAPRQARHTAFRDAGGEPLDDGIALWFPGPASFTGEDVLELHGHGGPVVLDLLLARVLALGARPARAGEFSERAFLNGKLDLAQAEAIADLIEAGTGAAARAARRTLEGALSARVHALHEQLLALRVRVEGALDFPDEDDVVGIPPVALIERLTAITTDLAALQREAQRGNLLREGASVAIVGRPNVGKSSLLNALVGADVAIVTPVPGTTRDTVREQLDLDGLPVRIVDTAGLRETADPVESIGVQRARAAAAAADLVLLVRDDASAPDADDERIANELDIACLTVFNKVDLSGAPPGVRPATGAVADAVAVSALTGAGIDCLRTTLRARLAEDQTVEGAFSARRRHLESLSACRAALEHATAAAGMGLELVAEELRLAGRALGEITGEVTSEDLLGEIFSTFCIGK